MNAQIIDRSALEDDTAVAARTEATRVAVTILTDEDLALVGGGIYTRKVNTYEGQF